VKTENPSVCVTVNCKLCKSVILLVIKSDCNRIANKSDHPIQIPLLLVSKSWTRGNIITLN
jgi:hypothetical protein